MVSKSKRQEDAHTTLPIVHGIKVRVIFYPYVTSSQDDYAGSNGKPMQLLQIQAFDNNGTKLTPGVVVMYRVHVGGRWLPWVSNADPEWMQSVFDKHHLDGSLDTTSADAGLPDKILMVWIFAFMNVILKPAVV